MKRKKIVPEHYVSKNCVYGQKVFGFLATLSEDKEGACTYQLTFYNADKQQMMKKAFIFRSYGEPEFDYEVSRSFIIVSCYRKQRKDVCDIKIINLQKKQMLEIDNVRRITTGLMFKVIESIDETQPSGVRYYLFNKTSGEQYLEKDNIGRYFLDKNHRFYALVNYDNKIKTYTFKLFHLFLKSYPDCDYMLIKWKQKKKVTQVYTVSSTTSLAHWLVKKRENGIVLLRLYNLYQPRIEETTVNISLRKKFSPFFSNYHGYLVSCKKNGVDSINVVIINPKTMLHYKIKQVDPRGTFEFHGPVFVYKIKGQKQLVFLHMDSSKTKIIDGEWPCIKKRDENIVCSHDKNLWELPLVIITLDDMEDFWINGVRKYNIIRNFCIFKTVETDNKVHFLYLDKDLKTHTQVPCNCYFSPCDDLVYFFSDRFANKDNGFACLGYWDNIDDDSFNCLFFKHGKHIRTFKNIYCITEYLNGECIVLKKESDYTILFQIYDIKNEALKLSKPFTAVFEIENQDVKVSIRNSFVFCDINGGKFFDRIIVDMNDLQRYDVVKNIDAIRYKHIDDCSTRDLFLFKHNKSKDKACYDLTLYDALLWKKQHISQVEKEEIYKKKNKKIMKITHKNNIKKSVPLYFGRYDKKRFVKNLMRCCISKHYSDAEIDYHDTEGVTITMTIDRCMKQHNKPKEKKYKGCKCM